MSEMTASTTHEEERKKLCEMCELYKMMDSLMKIVAYKEHSCGNKTVLMCLGGKTK